MPDDRVPYRLTPAAAPYDGLRLPAAILLDNVRSMYNVGAFFRTADGVALERIYLTGITARPPMKEITKTALGADLTVPWEGIADPVTLLASLRAKNWEIAAIETSVPAVDIFDWQPRFPVCVLFGHEVDGVQPELLNLADTHVRLPMLGQKHSLNVATAGGIVLYELLRKYRRMGENKER